VAKVYLNSVAMEVVLQAV